MPSAVVLCKFVGTISLGLLTGVSYTLSTQSLPALLTLESARPAAYTLSQTIRLANLHLQTLSAVSTLALGSAFLLSPSRVRHPYLLWTALIAGASGAMSLTNDQLLKQWVAKEDVEDVNGEIVEKKARDQQRFEFVKTGVSALAFTMTVIGIWGEGA